jgi:hypothetical protein
MKIYCTTDCEILYNLDPHNLVHLHAIMVNKEIVQVNQILISSINRLCTLSSLEFFFYLLGYYCFFLPKSQSNINEFFLCIHHIDHQLIFANFFLLLHAYDIHLVLCSSSINLFSLSISQSLFQSHQSLQIYPFVLVTMLQRMFVNSPISSDMAEINSNIS